MDDFEKYIKSEMNLRDNIFKAARKLANHVDIRPSEALRIAADYMEKYVHQPVPKTEDGDSPVQSKVNRVTGQGDGQAPKEPPKPKN